VRQPADGRRPEGPEQTYPLRLYFCPDSGLAQLDYVVPGDVVYYPEYPYRSSITAELAVYQRAFVKEVVTALGLSIYGLCVDIGANDGTLKWSRLSCSFGGGGGRRANDNA
jgi:hypothetical protein